MHAPNLSMLCRLTMFSKGTCTHCFRGGDSLQVTHTPASFVSVLADCSRSYVTPMQEAIRRCGDPAVVHTFTSQSASDVITALADMKTPHTPQLDRALASMASCLCENGLPCNDPHEISALICACGALGMEDGCLLKDLRAAATGGCVAVWDLGQVFDIMVACGNLR